MFPWHCISPDSAKSAGRAPVVKNDHKLNALAIKKNQIHVVGGDSRVDETRLCGGRFRTIGL
jgi:hypothetical protein